MMNLTPSNDLSSIYNWKIIKNFQYLYNILWKLWRNETLTVEEYNLFGGRDSAKTKSVQILICLMFLLRCDVSIHIFRNLKSSIKETIWKDILEIIKTVPNWEKFKINYSTYEIQHHLKPSLRIKCFNLRQQKTDTVALKGLWTVNTRYIVNVIEEANEISYKDSKAIQSASRSTHPLYQLLTFYISNPDSLNNWIIKRFSKVNPYILPTEANINYLQEHGYKKIVQNNKMYHLSNFRVNPYLTKQKIKMYNDMLTEDIELAKPWNYGVAGIEGDTVFNYLLKWVKPPIKEVVNSCDIITAGLDFGFKKDLFAFLLIGINSNTNQTVILEEFKWDNSKAKLSHQEISYKLLILLSQWSYTYNFQDEIIDVYCDNADYAWISILSEMCNELNLTYLNFTACKKPPLEWRVGHIRTLMSKKKLFMSEAKTPTFYNELTNAQFDKTKERLILMDVNNHFLDAFIYGTYQYLFNINDYMKEPLQKWT